MWGFIPTRVLTSVFYHCQRVFVRIPLRIEDEVDDETVLFLGRAHRGESAKTGREQGVRIDWGYVRDLIRRRLGDIEQRHGPNDRGRVNVFSISRSHFRRVWAGAQRALELPDDAPHAMRHTGPSRDVAEGYRSMLQVQRRGRWNSERSLLRYAKTHAWFAAVGRQSAAVRERGAVLLASRRGRAEKAKE